MYNISCVKNSIISLVELWVHKHISVILCAIIAIGLTIRVFNAIGTYLNPDEALIYLLSNQSSISQVYKASLTNAHPPLFYFFLYLWRLIGNTEVILRLPSIIAGAALIGLVYAWLKEMFDMQTALIGSLITAFSPTLISLSAEVRQYSFLLFFMACSLYFLEHSIKYKSRAIMFIFSLFLFLSIMIHYSALWVTITVSIYVYFHIAKRHLTKNLIKT